MKQLLFGVVAILVIGLAAFLFRNIMARPVVPQTTEACPRDAKMCPDGTTVGRTGPACNFSACMAPNVEHAEGFAYATPAGYAANKNALGQDETLLAAYEKAGPTPPHAIVVRRFPITGTKSIDQVILENTMFEPSGMQPKSMSEFTKVTIGSTTFQTIVLERFEGHVHSAYYLPRMGDVLRFEVLERDVDWTNPKLVIRDLPQHKTFEQMLKTLIVYRP